MKHSEIFEKGMVPEKTRLKWKVLCSVVRWISNSIKR